MKKLIHSTLVAAALLIGAGAANAQAIEAEVKFPFTFAGKNLEPGAYRVEKVASSIGTPLYRLSGLDSKKTVVALARHEQFAANSERHELIFRCAEGACELTEVWLAGRVNAELPRSNRMKEVESVAVIRVPAS